MASADPLADLRDRAEKACRDLQANSDDDVRQFRVRLVIRDLVAALDQRPAVPPSEIQYERRSPDGDGQRGSTSKPQHFSVSGRASDTNTTPQRGADHRWLAGSEPADAQTSSPLPAAVVDVAACEAHDFREFMICRHCGRTEADIMGECHHCSGDQLAVGKRCWWCLRLQGSSAAASVPLPAAVVHAPEEQRIRELLWLNHGHSGMALYGDDGEMQCHQCAPLWDYKRTPLSDLVEHVLSLRAELPAAVVHALTLARDSMKCAYCGLLARHEFDAALAAIDAVLPPVTPTETP